MVYNHYSAEYNFELIRSAEGLKSRIPPVAQFARFPFDFERRIREPGKPCLDQFLHFQFGKILIDRGFVSAMLRNPSRPRVPFLSWLICSFAASYFPALISAAVVTLDSIEIFRTHEWFPSKPAVYFQCKDGNMTHLPDVKEKNVFYAFKGEESWQPLLDLEDKKCKRCGFYEKDTFKPDDVFDEWEFCASDFTRNDGKYIHFKDGELNATFLCPDCVPLGSASDHSSKPRNRSNWLLILLICALAIFVFIGGSVIGYKYWQRRKQQQEHARFLRMFDEGDEDLEDELGIGPLSHVV